MAEQEMIKLSNPIITPDKTFVQFKKNTFKNKGKLTICKEISSKEEGSELFFSLDGQEPKEYGELYKNPISLALDYRKETVLKTVNTKEGFEDSDIVERKYMQMFVYIKAFNNRKVNIKKNRKTIYGKVYTNNLIKKYDLTRYVTIKIKRKNGIIEKYETKVKGNKWSKKLKTKMNAGDKLYISATTKKCVIKFKKIDNTSETIGVSAYAPEWVSNKYILKNGKLINKGIIN